ncbi:MAG TPA: nucleotidyl transferase AbiEii/AbiGii toxin family protein [Puia sp.]|nr:nucleotidyl transferase AbiEii/AbiGii toxin family protein [Puia sp.]
MTKDLLELIRELQTMESLGHFALAGGSNLSLRFNHRKSIDIDLFTNRIVGVEGWKLIERSIREKFGAAVLFCNLLNEGLGSQYCFLRALIIKGEEQIKVDMIQNVQHIDPIEDISGVRMLSIMDIGLFKLMAASNRFARKDFYDLDLITDNIPLHLLLKCLKEKKDQFKEDRHKSLFDLDHAKDPLDDVSALLPSEELEFRSSDSRHTHSNDRIDILAQGKTWLAAKSSWKRKIKRITG